MAEQHLAERPPDLAQRARSLAAKVRYDVVRMTSRGASSHVASGLSIADILAVLYTSVLRVRPGETQAPERDRFILSKGHAGAAVYAVLAESGFFPVEKLETHYQNGSDLSGHVSHKNVPGVEFSTGSLGHGLGVSAGLAYSMKLRKSKARAYCLLSDGECDEGSNWEAFLFAGHHGLANLMAIIDYNKIQSLTSVAQTLELEPLAAKLAAFRWEVREVDGHDHAALHKTLSRPAGTQPLAVIAHTTKGKGVSFMENSVLWHYRSPQGSELEAALRELQAGLE